MGARTRLVKPPCPLHGGSVLSARHGQHTRRGPLPTAGRRPLPTDGRRGRPCSAPTPAQQARPRRGRGPTVLEAAPRTLKAHTPRHTEVLEPRSEPEPQQRQCHYATVPPGNSRFCSSWLGQMDSWTAASPGPAPGGPGIPGMDLLHFLQPVPLSGAVAVGGPRKVACPLSLTVGGWCPCWA